MATTPAAQTETFAFTGIDTLVPAGSTLTFIALSDSVGNSFTFNTTTTNPDGSYSLTQTVPLSDVNFPDLFVEVSDPAGNNLVHALGGTAGGGSFSFTDNGVVNEQPPPPPPPSGGLKSDLQTLIKDFLAHDSASQLKTDLTAVLSDIKNHNFGGADPGSTTFAAVSFIDHLPASVIAGSHSGH